MKTAIVTGAASGIGLAVAKKFLSEGYVVYGMSRREVSPITHECFHYISGDISTSADREKLVAAAQRIGVLVNVAGVAPKIRADLLEMTEESYDRVMDINLKGTFFLPPAPSSGNNPTPLKTPDFKGFYSSRFAIDSKKTPYI